ncbi:unannotated protein [freshwater metagenome]
MVELISRTNRELGCTFVIATHDPLLAEGVGRVVRMRDGQVVE